MNKRLNDQSGNGSIGILLVVAILLLVGVVSWLVYNNHKSTTTKLRSRQSSTNASTQTAKILPPQTTKPVTTECSLPITIGQDGNAGPLFCNNGGINILAWNYTSKSAVQVMGQGPKATPGQVKAAMCADTANGKTTNVIESSGEELAAKYNGWSFGNDTQFTEYEANCP